MRRIELDEYDVVIYFGTEAHSLSYGNFASVSARAIGWICLDSIWRTEGTAGRGAKVRSSTDRVLASQTPRTRQSTRQEREHSRQVGVCSVKLAESLIS